MTLRFIIAVFLVLLGCDRGGSLSLESNALLNGSRSVAVGSCVVPGHALVLVDGYCVDFQRVLPSSDDPRALCGSAGGNWSASSCPRPPDLAGRCLVKTAGDIDLVYFAGTSAGSSRCSAEANSMWQANF